MKKETEKTNEGVKSVNFKEVIKIKLLFCLYLPIQLCINISLLLFGVLNNLVIVFQGRGNKWIGGLIWRLVMNKKKLFFLVYSIKDDFEPNMFEKNERICRLSLVYRFLAFITYTFVWTYLIIAHIIGWVMMLLDSVHGSSAQVSEESLKEDFNDIEKSIYYLSGISEEKPEWKSLDNYLMTIAFLSMLFYIFFQVGSKIENYSVGYSVTFTLIYILLFVILIPEFIKFNKVFPEGMRKEFGNIKPEKMIKTIIVAIGILVTELLIIYGIQLAVDSDPQSWYVDFIGFEIYLGIALKAGITEEIFFRGAIISLTKEKIGYVKSILVSAAIFGLAHISSNFGNPGTLGRISHIISTFFVGIYLGYYFILSKSLLGPIIVHTFYNVVTLMVYFETEKLSGNVINWITMGIQFLVMIIIMLFLKKVYKDKEILIFSPTKWKERMKRILRRNEM